MFTFSYLHVPFLKITSCSCFMVAVSFPITLRILTLAFTGFLFPMFPTHSIFSEFVFLCIILISTFHRRHFSQMFEDPWHSVKFFFFFFWFVFWFLIGADNNDWKLCILVGPINDWFYLRWLERTVSMGKFQVFQYPYVIALGFLTFPRKSLFQFSVWQVPEHV